jgi:D-lyxose ketol-isomerase
MKRLLIIVMAFAFSMAVKAQDTTAQKMHQKMKEDHVMMKDNKLIQMKDGKMMDLTEDVTLTNGTVIMKDGNVKMKDGTTVMLKNGDYVTMDGTIKHWEMKKPKDN